MANTAHRQRLAELGAQIADREIEIADLTAVVGDPEDVVDNTGWLPRDCRELMLTLYAEQRHTAVYALHAAISKLQAADATTTDKTQRAHQRNAVREATTHLAKWLAVAPLTAEDMCSECVAPAAQHGWRTPPYDGPCPSWPRSAARARNAYEMLDIFPLTPVHISRPTR